LGRLAARLAGVPVVVHTYHGHVLHGYFGRPGSVLLRGAERLLSPLSDTLLAVSEAVKRELVDYGIARASKIRVVPLGLDLEPLAGRLPRGVLRREAGFPEDAPLIGVVGRLVPIKDIGTFLEAAALVRNSFPTSRFAVVGDGQERDLLEARVPTLGLSGVVRFFGWRRDMAAIYGDLDVVVNSSKNEGTPVSLIEALAGGRPVVATRVGGTPDLLGDDRGLLVPAGDPPALATGILECLRDPAAAMERARGGQRHVLRHHALGRLIDDMDGLYRELLAGRAGAG
jgi:glycosyltransferase involved in cell wall biosynthesis